MVPVKIAQSQTTLTEGDKAVRLFLQSKNIGERTTIAFTLGEYFWANRKLSQAKNWYKTCLSLTPNASDSNNVVNTLHLLANIYLNETGYDSALFYCNKSFAAIGEINNKKFLPNLLQTKGRIYLALDDQLSAIQLFLTADSLYLASPDGVMKAQSPYIKILLGQIFEKQQQMDRAREYFDMALQLSEAQTDIDAKASCLQTIANWHCKMKQFKKARNFYFELLRPPLLNSGSYRMIYIYTGLGDVYLGLNMPDSSLHYYRMGMQESKDKGELYQQDIFYGKLGDVYSKLHIFSLAKLYYDSTLLLGRKNKNRTASINAYQNLADIAIIENDYRKAYEYLQLKQQLNDSVLNLKNLQMSNNLYNLNNIKQKDVAINMLTVLDADNRKLIKQGKTITYLLCAFAGMLTMSFLIFINRLKLKKKLENQLAITQERERIITDLHDDVGATLSSMYIYSELAGNMLETKQAESKKLMDKISAQGKDLSGRMSDIIWSLKATGEEKNSLTGRLKNYSQELISGKGINTDFDINTELESSIINPLVRKNILLIAKEAMNNIAKYSQATNAIISFQKTESNVVFTISDNGIGFENNDNSSGNGLHNIMQRCRNLQGTCTISSSHTKGTLVHCSFPMTIISQIL